MNDDKFVKGLRFFMPNPKAPKFVKLNFLVKTDEFVEWLKKNSVDGEVRFDLLKSKAGKLYLALNDWKKGDKAEQTEQADKDFNADINQALNPYGN